MRFHVDVRASFGLLVLVPMLGGCDLESTEIGATAELGTPTGGDASGGSSSDTGVVFGSMDCEEGGIPIVSGTVHRLLGDHTWNESFEPTPATFVDLHLRTHNPDGTTGNGGENLMMFEGLPFDFALCFSEEPEFDDDVVYTFGMYIFRNRLMSELVVGDMAAEGSYPIDGPTYGLEVVVGGIEPCDAPYADEQCSPFE